MCKGINNNLNGIKERKRFRVEIDKKFHVFHMLNHREIQSN